MAPLRVPKGFTADGVHAGFKKEKLDFGWIVSKVPASVAGVYTTNKVIAAPLLVTKQSIATKQQMQAIVVNSGVANSCTGQKGFEDALFMQEASANQLGIEKDLVGIASTGVIGEFLPLQTVASGLKQLDLDGHAEQFAQAILTTDTGTKTITVQEEIFGFYGDHVWCCQGIRYDSPQYGNHVSLHYLRCIYFKFASAKSSE